MKSKEGKLETLWNREIVQSIEMCDEVQLKMLVYLHKNSVYSTRFLISWKMYHHPASSIFECLFMYSLELQCFGCLAIRFVLQECRNGMTLKLPPYTVWLICSTLLYVMLFIICIAIIVILCCCLWVPVSATCSVHIADFVAELFWNSNEAKRYMIKLNSLIMSSMLYKWLNAVWNEIFFGLFHCNFRRWTLIFLSSGFVWCVSIPATAECRFLSSSVPFAHFLAITLSLSQPSLHSMSLDVFGGCGLVANWNDGFTLNCCNCLPL